MSSYQLNSWIVHPTQCEIVDAELGTMVQLEPQLMKLLTYLVERQNEVVTRDELANEIWTGVAIEDNTISRAITRLRKTLNDDYRQPQYIKTLPKRGYRLVAKVSEYHPQEGSDYNLAGGSLVANNLVHDSLASSDLIDNNLAAESVIGQNRAKTRVSSRLLLSIILTSLVVIAVIALVILQSNQTRPTPSTHYDTRPLSSQTGREYSPSFSADGNHFVFVGNNQSDTWLYLQQRGQDSAVPLVRLNDPNTKPQWSPIKDSIIYAEQTNDHCELILLEKVTSSSMLQKRLMPCQQKMRMRPEWHQQEYAIYFIQEKNVE
ncbi:MAG: winged helix-turn-helix domain-containing protein, partial [Kangiellaceae bacterium]|nr:winged helix-turn-helix domain-containing protein [Kangiellaceae bacterium]